MLKLRIETYSHHFTAEVLDESVRDIIKLFLKGNLHFFNKIDWKGRSQRELRARYYATSYDKSIVRLFIGQLESFKIHLQAHGVTDEHIEYINHEVDISKCDNIKFDIDPSFTLRDIQNEAIEYTLNGSSPIKIVEMKTGEGKSLVSLKVASILNSRIVMVIKAAYIDKWIRDIEKDTDISPKEICKINGMSSLKSILDMGVNGEIPYKAILISTATFRNFLVQYEHMPEEDFLVNYPCRPQDYMQVLGAKVLLLDEGHQEFHFLFKLFLYTHCKLSLTTTATLVPDDPFIRKMANLVYPPYDKYQPDTHAPYIDIVSMKYQFLNTDKLSYKGPQGYSHVMLEQSIMKSESRLQHYLEMISSIVKKEYIPKYQKGRKCIIFVSTVDMTTKLSEHLKGVYEELDIRRYVSEDDYANLLEPDIRVTTLGSAGTAHDIPGLYLSILTVALNSSQTNKQGIGRLRPLPDIHPVFYFLSCKQIDSHLFYLRNKRDLYKDKLLTYSDVDYPDFI